MATRRRKPPQPVPPGWKRDIDGSLIRSNQIPSPTKKEIKFRCQVIQATWTSYQWDRRKKGDRNLPVSSLNLEVIQALVEWWLQEEEDDQSD